MRRDEYRYRATGSICINATFASGTQNIIMEELINHTEALSLAKEKGGNICIRYE